MNLYVTPHELRQALGLQNARNIPDAEFEIVLSDTCRYIDDAMGRWFYVLSAARTYDGPGGTEWWLPDDVISISALGWDEDGDDSFGTALVEGTDYRGYPYNEGHFRRLDTISYTGAVINAWPKGRLRITGKFGWAEETEATGDTVEDNPLADDATSITVNDGSNFHLGETLLIETEQVYVSSVEANELTVTRGVNGTTAAAHVQNTAITRYVYPGPLKSAIKMEAARWWREQNTGFSGATQSIGESGFASFRLTWPAILDRLGVYRMPAMIVSF